MKDKIVGSVMMVILVSVLTGVTVMAMNRASTSVKEAADAKREEKRAKEDRDSIIRLAAGGWKFPKNEPINPADELSKRIDYLEKIYRESIKGREDAVRDFGNSKSLWDKQIQDLATKLAKHKEELARLKEAKK